MPDEVKPRGWFVCTEAVNEYWRPGYTIGGHDPRITGPDGEPVVVRIADMAALAPDDERIMNARLIASAPDLYEALKAWIDHREEVFRAQILGHELPPTSRIDEIVAAARAALSRTRGAE